MTSFHSGLSQFQNIFLSFFLSLLFLLFERDCFCHYDARRRKSGINLCDRAYLMPCFPGSDLYRDAFAQVTPRLSVGWNVTELKKKKTTCLLLQRRS